MGGRQAQNLGEFLLLGKRESCKIEDHLGYSYPYFTYSLKYTDTSRSENVLRIPMGRYQYFPLQLNGVFGSMPVNLISEIVREEKYIGNFTTTYQYDLTNGRVTNYRELRDGGVNETFSVQWTE